jgi:transposase InsO family protein
MNVAPASLVNVKVGVASLVGLLGPPVIVTVGATVSTVHDRCAGVASTFPAASVARTRNVCGPCPSALSARGEVHATNAATSRLLTNEFRDILLGAGMKCIKLPAQSPDLNAYAERFVLSIKSECLNKISSRLANGICDAP